MVCELLPTDLPVELYVVPWKKKKKKKKWTKVVVLTISISICDRPF